MLDRIMMVPWVCKECTHTSKHLLGDFYTRKMKYGKMLSRVVSPKSGVPRDGAYFYRPYGE